MSENVEQCILLRRVSILLWDKWPTCLSDQNVSTEKNQRWIQWAQEKFSKTFWENQKAILKCQCLS